MHFKLFCSAPNTSHCRQGFQTTRLTSISNCFLKHQGSSAGLAQGQLPVAKPRGQRGSWGTAGPNTGLDAARAKLDPALQPGSPAHTGPMAQGQPQSSPTEPSTRDPPITNPPPGSWSLQDSISLRASALTQLVLLTVLIADPGKTVLSRADSPRLARNQPKPLGQRKDPTRHLLTPRSARDRFGWLITSIAALAPHAQRSSPQPYLQLPQNIMFQKQQNSLI